MTVAPSGAASAAAMSRGTGSDIHVRLELEAEIRGGRGMRERADRYVIGAGLRELRDALERHAARQLRLRAPGNPPDRFPDVLDRKVVDQDDVGARGNRLVHLRETLRLDLDRHFLTRGLHRSHYHDPAAPETNMVVLDQDPVVESRAMVRAAAGAHGVLLERAKRRRRLPG